MQAIQTPASKLRFVTPDKESRMSKFWQQEKFKQICSRELLTEKAEDVEKMISVKEHERERYAMSYEHRFWNRKPDGIVISRYHRTLYLQEFKWSSDRNKDFLKVKEDEANEQHKSIIESLRAAAPNGRLKRSILWQEGVVQL